MKWDIVVYYGHVSVFYQNIGMVNFGSRGNYT